MGNNLSVSGPGQPSSSAAEAVTVPHGTSTSKILNPGRSDRARATSTATTVQASPAPRGPLQSKVTRSSIATKRANVTAAVPIPDAAVRMIQPPTSAVPPDARRAHRILSSIL